MFIRLNLTPTMSAGGGGVGGVARSGTPSRRTPTRAVKRKRTMLEESSAYTVSEFQTSSTAKGDVEVAEVDSEGKFIRLQNKGEKVSSDDNDDDDVRVRHYDVVSHNCGYR